MQNPDKKLSIYIEASGGVAATVKTIKKFVDYMQIMGYGKLYLGCADMIEIEDEPYFGYLRGRYTAKEIKEIDRYCIDRGITFVVTTQTLAHQKSIPAYDRFKKIIDCQDVLLCDNEDTYEFIEKIIKTVASNTTSKIIHLGMDEAFLLGAGKYLRINGYVDRKEIFLRHLKRVCEIAEKYDLTCELWGDMFYHSIDSVLTSDADKEAYVKICNDKLPKNARLVYWNYTFNDKETLEEGIDKHKLICNDLIYASTLYKWIGFAPDNQLSLNKAKIVCDACREKKVSQLLLTLWSDSNGDSSLFSILPSMYAYSEIYKNNATSIEDVDKQKFKDIVGIDFDDFIYLDKLNKPYDNKQYDKLNNKSFLYLYNDPLVGMFDSMLSDGLEKAYRKIAKKIKSINAKEFSYFFKTLEDLALVLVDKCTLGKNLRQAYKQNDLEKLSYLANKVVKRTIRNVKSLSDALEKQWEIENKPFGLEVHTARLGSLLLRLEYVRKTVNRYINNELEKIVELEEELLPFGYRLGATEDDYFYMCWRYVFTAGVCR